MGWCGSELPPCAKDYGYIGFGKRQRPSRIDTERVLVGHDPTAHSSPEEGQAQAVDELPELLVCLREGSTLPNHQQRPAQKSYSNA